MGSPERGGDQTPGRMVSDFFIDSVERLLQDNLESVLSDSWDGQSVQVLHLIDPKPPGGEPLRYHYVYEQFDSGRHTSTHGILIARPYAMMGDHIAIGDSRHYFEQGRGLVVRRDRSRRGNGSDYEFLKGTDDPAVEDDPSGQLLLNDLHNDVLRMEHSQPLRPMSNLFRNFILPGLH